MTKYLLVFLCAFFICAAGRAQLCQGSLGDPIVNITFGKGANPGPPLPAAVTSYAYTTTECPDDGSYTIRNSTDACFQGTWHSLATDHTNDGSGYFMLVNAAFEPSAFYVDTVRGLCPNSTYEFAAWIMNMLLPTACSGIGIKPDITFRIEKPDGTLLQSYNSAAIASTNAGEWRQYGFFFTTPAGAPDIVLRMINNSEGGCGNDLALDDITFRPCGPSLTPSIVGGTGNTTSFCEGVAQSFTFNCTVSGGFTNPAYQWQQLMNGIWTDIAGATTTMLNRNFPANTAPGTYSYRMAVAEAGNLGSPQCRIASLPLTITVNALPQATASNNGPVCAGSTLMLHATGGGSYAWSGPAAFSDASVDPTVSNAQAINGGKYYLTVTSPQGCKKKDSTIVTINPVPVAAASPSLATICALDSTHLSATGGITYTWSPAAGLGNPSSSQTNASPADSTKYMVVVSNTQGCTDTAYSIVRVLKRPAADAGPDRTIIAGTPIQILANAGGDGLSFFWPDAPFIDDPTKLRPVVTPPADQRYILQVNSNNGCGTDRDTMLVKVYKGIFIPSAFSPNGDGLNDTWSIPMLNAFPAHELMVYNRFGQVVFHSASVNTPWNGRFRGEPLPAATYVYLVKLGPGAGILKGTVIIIR